MRRDPAARVPNVTTGKVDIVIQFMTISSSRAQLVAFSRPYYIEGRDDGHAEQQVADLEGTVAAGAAVNAAILANVYADDLVHRPRRRQVLQLDSQANVFQAITAGRADVALVDASTVKWLVKRNPDIYGANPSRATWRARRNFSAAVRQGDPDWLQWVNTRFDVRHVRPRRRDLRRGLPGILRREAAPRVTGFPPM